MIKKAFTNLILALVMAAGLTASSFAADPGSAEIIELSDGFLVEEDWSDPAPAEQDVSNDELFAGYVDQMFYPKVKLRAAIPLEENDLIVFDYLKKKIAEIASGAHPSTVIAVPLSLFGLSTEEEFSAADLGVEALIEKRSDGEYYITEAAGEAMFGKIDFDPDKVFHQLLVSCPYELYWFDKTEGMKSDKKNSTGVMGNSSKIRFSDPTAYTLQFSVSQDYRGTGEYSVNTSIPDAVETAVTNANQVVAENAGKSDLRKLEAYRKYITDEVSYNHDAANGSTPYGNPWQLIWVFDGDKQTNVVCEGYSKAFQYLCDQGFKGSATVGCDIVTGTMTGATGAGLHMWNLVSINGSSYLADITNSDAGSIGGNGNLLFLAGADNAASSGYRIGNVSYTYDKATVDLYPENHRKIADRSYYDVIGAEHTHELTRHEKIDATCTAAGNSAYWSCQTCGKYFSDQNGMTEIEENSWVISAAGHHLNHTDALAAACEADGHVEYWQCISCKKYFSDAAAGIEITEADITIAALGHDWNEGEVTTPAGCETDGIRTFTCKRDANHTKTETIPKAGHNPENVEAKAASCTSDGYTAGTKCSVCGKTLSGCVKIAAGHKWGSWTVVIAATYDSDGEEKRICEYDHAHEETRSIPKLTKEPDTSAGSQAGTEDQSGNQSTDVPSGSGDTPAAGNQAGTEDQSGSGNAPAAGNQPGTGSQPTDVQSGSGSAPAAGSQPTDTQSGSENTPVTVGQTGKTTPAKAKEPVTIKKAPASVKAKAKKNKVTVSWKKVKDKKLLAQIKEIQVQYAADAKFTQSPVTKSVGKKNAKIVLKLKKKKTYYIRVRYKGTKGYSKWSAVKKVKTKK